MTDKSEPAFPTKMPPPMVIDDDGKMKEASGWNRETPGLTKREYFAAMAMMGLAAHGTLEIMAMNSVLAKMSVQYADALIEELSK